MRHDKAVSKILAFPAELKKRFPAGGRVYDSVLRRWGTVAGHNSEGITVRYDDGDTYNETGISLVTEKEINDVHDL